MKILLIQPPCYYDGKSRLPDLFPLGLGYIARPLLKSRHDVEVLDIWAHQWTNEEVLQRIQRVNYDIVGITAMSTQYAYIKWLTKELKKYHPNKKIVVGGALPTFSPEIVLRNTQTDICAIGEGEITFKELVENMDSLKAIKGIYFKQDNEVFRNPPREYIQDLDSIEFPALDIFPVDIYQKHCHVWRHPYIKAINILGTRGCPYRCRFCSRDPAAGVRLRFRSVDNIIQEFKTVSEKYGINGIFFNDDTLLANKRRVYDLCDGLEPLKIKWNCQGRANLVDLDLLKRMKKAGCVAVGYGIESGSQTILDNMNKKVTVEQAHRALEYTYQAGLDPIVQMMYGYPGETKETLQETVDFFKKAPCMSYRAVRVAAELTPTTAIPGAELYDQALAEGLIEDEEKYLKGLAAGYQPDSARLLINFTKFNGEEFSRLKKETERQIFLNYLNRCRFRLVMSYLIDRFKVVMPYAKEHGYRQTIRIILNRVLDLWLLIREKK